MLNRTDCESEHNIKTLIVDAKTDDVIAEGVSATLPQFVIPADADFLGSGLILPFRAVIFPHPGVYVVQLFVDGIMLRMLGLECLLWLITEA